MITVIMMIVIVTLLTMQPFVARIYEAVDTPLNSDFTS